MATKPFDGRSSGLAASKHQHTVIAYRRCGEPYLGWHLEIQSSGSTFQLASQWKTLMSQMLKEYFTELVKLVSLKFYDIFEASQTSCRLNDFGLVISAKLRSDNLSQPVKNMVQRNCSSSTEIFSITASVDMSADAKNG